MNSYTYTTHDSAASHALAQWTFESHAACETTVLPDGCQDIIIQYQTDGDSTWFVSDLSHSAYTVTTAAGIHMHGVRLLPGIKVRQTDLSAWMKGRRATELFEMDQLSEFCSRSANISTALECLAAENRSIACVAKELGVSLRTLERHVKASTGKSPCFWFSLARIRRAGRVLGELDSLSEVALISGFADQSHLTREMKKWFKRTPRELKKDRETLSLLNESGYG